MPVFLVNAGQWFGLPLVPVIVLLGDSRLRQPLILLPFSSLVDEPWCLRAEKLDVCPYSLSKEPVDKGLPECGVTGG